VEGALHPAWWTDLMDTSSGANVEGALHPAWWTDLMDTSDHMRELYLPIPPPRSQLPRSQLPGLRVQDLSRTPPRPIPAYHWEAGQNPKLQTLNPGPKKCNLKPFIHNLKPQTLNPIRYFSSKTYLLDLILYPKTWTLDRKP